MGLDKDFNALTRRDVLAGAAALGAAFALPAFALAQDPAGAQEAPALLGDAKPTAPVLPSRSHATATVLENGWVLLIGGIVAGRVTNSVAVVNPNTGEFGYCNPMRQPRARHAAVLLADGRVAVLGGVNGAHLATVEVYDPMTNVWTAATPLPGPRADFAVAICDGGVILMGGTGAIGPVGTAFYALRSRSTNP